MQLLHHPVAARDCWPPLGEVMMRPSAWCRRRQGVAGDLAGHQRLWRRTCDTRQRPARRAVRNPLRRPGARTGLRWASGCGCTTSIPIRMWTTYAADGRRRSAALPRHPVPARQPLGAEAHEAARPLREHAAADPRLARVVPDLTLRSSLSSAFPAKPMRSSRNCWPGWKRRSWIASAVSSTRRSTARAERTARSGAAEVRTIAGSGSWKAPPPFQRGLAAKVGRKLQVLVDTGRRR